MVSGKDEAVPLKEAARMLGMSDRGVAKLIKQRKLEERDDPSPRRGRGRPPIFVSRDSVVEYARAAGRVLREPNPEEAKGRHAGLSLWLTGNARLMSKLKRANVVHVDGEGRGNQVWVRFRSTPARGREILASFWRQDARGLFGARKFRFEIEGDRASVFVRSTDEELDRDELSRCVSAAVNCVTKEKGRLSGERAREKRR